MVMVSGGWGVEDDKAAGRVGGGGGLEGKACRGVHPSLSIWTQYEIISDWSDTDILVFSVLSADRNYSSRTAVCDYFVQ